MKWLGLLLVLAACQEPGRLKNDFVEDVFKYDTLAWGSAVLRYPDTSVAIRGIQKFLRDSIGDALRSGSFGCGQDTLIDLNGDDRLDYLREYYGEAGFGFKDRMEVVLAEGPEGNFRTCPQLSQLPNPRFLFDSAFVYGSYLGGGGGYGVKLRWQGNRLDTMLSIDVRVEPLGDEFAFHFNENDHVTGRTRTWTSDQADFPAAFMFPEGEPLIRGDQRISRLGNGAIVADSPARDTFALDAGAHTR